MSLKHIIARGGGAPAFAGQFAKLKTKAKSKFSHVGKTQKKKRKKILERKKFPTGDANPQSPENFRPTDLPFLKKYIFSIKFSKTLHFVFDILLDYSKDDVYSVSTRFKTIIYYVITIFEAQKKFFGIISHRISVIEFDRLWLPIINPQSPILNPQSPIPNPQHCWTDRLLSNFFHLGELLWRQLWVCDSTRKE